MKISTYFKRKRIILSLLLIIVSAGIFFAKTDLLSSKSEGVISTLYSELELKKIVKIVINKFSVLGQEAPLFFFPQFPQRLLYVSSEISRVSEELADLNEKLNKFTNQYNCELAQSQCKQEIKTGSPAACTPLSAFGSPSPISIPAEELETSADPERLENAEGLSVKEIQERIQGTLDELSFFQGLLKKEMESGLEQQLQTLREDDAQALRENLNKLLELGPKIAEPATTNLSLPEQCSVEKCSPNCQQGGSFSLEACLKTGVGEQKPMEAKFGAGVSLEDLELGEVGIKNINLSLPEEIEMPELGELPSFAISVPDITLTCPTDRKTLTLHSPTPALPDTPILKLGCPQYPNYSSYSCSALAGDESRSFIEAEWYSQIFSHLSENCLNVIQQDLTKLTTAEAQNAYQELMKKCLSPQQVSQTTVEECKKKWRERCSIFNCWWVLTDPASQEICGQIGSSPTKTPDKDKAVDWCKKVLQTVIDNKTVCIDDRPGLIYERNDSIARVYVSGTSPAGDWGANCGGEPGFWNSNDGKVLFLEWDWAQKLPGSRIEARGERGSKESPTVDTGPVTYTRPDSLTGTETIKTMGGRVYTSSGAQWPTDRRVRATWIIPGIEEPTPTACSSDPIGTLRQKCKEIRNAGIEEVPLSCKLLPLFSGQLEDALPDTIIGGGGTCPAQTMGDYPEPAAGCSFGLPSAPKITFPKIIIPDIRLPSINLPPFFRVKLPNFIFEDLVLPDLELCNLDDCQFQFPYLSFKIPALKIPQVEIPAIQVPNAPQLEVKVAPIQFPSLSFNLPQLFNLGSLATPELKMPSISLPQPKLQISFQGIKIDLLNILLGLFKIPSSLCVSLDVKFGAVNIVYPDYIFSWPAFPRIPEIPFCQDARQFCRNAKSSIQEVTNKTAQIQNQVNAVFQTAIQDKLDQLAKTLQQEIQNSVQAQANDISQKISQAIAAHLATYVPEYAAPPSGAVPVPGILPVEREIPCDKIPPLTMPMDDIVIPQKKLSDFVSFPDKIPIPWPADLKKIALSGDLDYELPTILLSLLSYSKEVSIKLPGVQRSSPSISFDLLENAAACMSRPPSGGNPCPTDQIQSNLEEIKKLRDETKEASQNIRNVLE